MSCRRHSYSSGSGLSPDMLSLLTGSSPSAKKPSLNIETFVEADATMRRCDTHPPHGLARPLQVIYTKRLAQLNFAKAMPKGGRLVFKGGEVAVSSRGKKKDKIKRKRERALAKAEAEGGMPSTGNGAAGAAGGASAAGNAEGGKQGAFGEEEMIPVSGTGRITSSGTAVQGHEAKFMDELHAGDAILVTHPTT